MITLGMAAGLWHLERSARRGGVEISILQWHRDGEQLYAVVGVTNLWKDAVTCEPCLVQEVGPMEERMGDWPRVGRTGCRLAPGEGTTVLCWTKVQGASYRVQAKWFAEPSDLETAWEGAKKCFSGKCAGVVVHSVYSEMRNAE